MRTIRPIFRYPVTSHQPVILTMFSSILFLIFFCRAHIDKDFLSEFADVDIKTRVQTKIFNALEEEISKLKLLV